MPLLLWFFILSAQISLYACISPPTEELSSKWHVVDDAEKLTCRRDIIHKHSPNLRVTSLHYLAMPDHLSDHQGLYYGEAYQQQARKIIFHLPADNYQPDSSVDVASIPLLTSESLLALQVLDMGGLSQPIALSGQEKDETFRVVFRDLLSKELKHITMNDFLYASDLSLVSLNPLKSSSDHMLLTGYTDQLLWQPFTLRQGITKQTGHKPPLFRYGGSHGEHLHFFYTYSSSSSTLTIEKLTTTAKQAEYSLPLAFQPYRMALYVSGADEVWVALIEKTQNGSQNNKTSSDLKQVLHLHKIHMDASSSRGIKSYQRLLHTDAYYDTPFFMSYQNKLYVSYLSWIYQDKALAILELHDNGSPGKVTYFSGLDESAQLEEVIVDADPLRIIMREGKDHLKRRYSICTLPPLP
ncbi:MAG: hypothetical protein OXC44_01760 [Proteobacteria bacterium]|nr:hypothetical protein [Pseudomonadota bacterium]